MNLRTWGASALAVAAAGGLGAPVPGAAQEAGGEPAATELCCLLSKGRDAWEGPCDGWGATLELHLARGPTAAGPWNGALSVPGSPERGELDVELARSRYGSREVLVFRSPLGWFHVATWRPAGGDEAQLVVDVSAPVGPTDADRRILAEALGRLDSDSAWDRADDRNCENDLPGVVGLYCALAGATAAELGRAYHRPPAMRLVREVVADRFPDRVVSHRLMDFNNHPDTTLEDVRAVIEEALVRARGQ